MPQIDIAILPIGNTFLNLYHCEALQTLEIAPISSYRFVMDLASQQCEILKDSWDIWKKK